MEGKETSLRVILNFEADRDVTVDLATNGGTATGNDDCSTTLYSSS